MCLYHTYITIIKLLDNIHIKLHTEVNTLVHGATLGCPHTNFIGLRVSQACLNLIFKILQAWVWPDKMTPKSHHSFCETMCVGKLNLYVQ